MGSASDRQYVGPSAIDAYCVLVLSLFVSFWVILILTTAWRPSLTPRVSVTRVATTSWGGIRTHDGGHAVQGPVPSVIVCQGCSV